MAQRKSFYKYISVHTFLIGIFPFYLPVFLWKLGYSLADISFFIALSGLGYCSALWAWERIHRKVSLEKVILLSFLLELLLLSAVYVGESRFFLPAVAILYGVYSCFFWITNRVLFVAMVTPGDSGRHYGNFQIVVAVILKVGVFIGGLMLDRYGYESIFIVSLLVSILGVSLFFGQTNLKELSHAVVLQKPLNLVSLSKFKDEFNSRFIFAIDGLFLFLESFFWLISLFIIVKESYWQLGLLVIGLMLIFGLIFYLIKNRIDRLPSQIVYQISVLLYVLSWVLRGMLDAEVSLSVLITALILISFSTSMFRLAFNKRFFDHAKHTATFQYIFVKSYYTQFFIAVIFGMIGVVLLRFENVDQALRMIYFAAGFIAVGYCLYQPTRSTLIAFIGDTE